ncbi:origin recognition complex subunit 4 C-terminus-domain-containing protein [Mrakia frigida]|uniref:origin recognition complex subunit 4 n=1 Tax=Mrakia frigida TaxID=29902 RepID=UPI003FCC064E
MAISRSRPISSPSSVLIMDPTSSSSPSGSRQEEEDPMLLSPLKKKRKTTDTRAQQDPQPSTSSPRNTRLSASKQAGPSRTRSTAAASSSPLKRSSPRKKKVELPPPAPPPSTTTRTTRNSSSPAKKPTPIPAATTPSKRAKKEDAHPAPSSSRKRGGARPSRISRSPSPSSSTSPRKPVGWVGWEIATAPAEELPSKGFDSGLEILKKQGLLDPDAQFRLRNGRAVVGRLDEKRKRGVGRWGDGDDEEEEEEGGAAGDEKDVEAALGLEKGKEDEDDELEVEKPPTMDDQQQPEEMDWQPLHQQPLPSSSYLSLQPTLEPHLLAHLPKTKALVLAHLTGRVPPLPPAPPAPAPPKPDPKGKGKAKAFVAPSALEVPAEENEEGVKTLVELLRGTVERGEGNSCLIQGVRGGGKTTVLNKALETIAASSSSSTPSAPPPIVIRLSALIQTDDRAAIREIGRQVGAEGFDKDDGAAEDAVEGEGDGGEPKEVLQITTLPSHLLAILTAPSKKAIVIVLEEFDLFAGFGRGGRQMLLYCLLDVVQSIRPTLSTTTLSSRGVAVVGLTSRVDTLHLLEKRVKSRFSHRIIRISSPMHGDRSGTVSNLRHPIEGEEEEEEEEEKEEVPKWVGVVGRALVPWETWEEEEVGEEGEEGLGEWRGLWRSSVGKVLEDEEVKKGMERLSWMSSDVRAVLKIFIRPMIELSPNQPLLTSSRIIASLAEQAEGPGWGKDMRKLAGLSPPSLAVLASVKDLGERGIIEFNFEHIFFTYGEFAKAKLVGSGKPRFSRGIMREAFNQLISTSLIFPSSSTTNLAFSTMSTSGMDFVKHRCAVPAFDIVEFFRGEGGRGVMTQLSAWGKKWDV